MNPMGIYPFFTNLSAKTNTHAILKRGNEYIILDDNTYFYINGEKINKN